jgi:hypothetical protein
VNMDITAHGHTESSSLDVEAAEIWAVSQPIIPTSIVPTDIHASDTDHHN